MKKIVKERVDRFGEDSVSSVVKIGSTYAVKRDVDGLILAIGKELKGYAGDIIRVMYDGWSLEEGRNNPYLLTSDRHGLICKFS